MRDKMLSAFLSGCCFLVTFTDCGFAGSAEANYDAESDTFSLDLSVADGFRRVFRFGSVEALCDKVAALPEVTA